MGPLFCVVLALLQTVSVPVTAQRAMPPPPQPSGRQIEAADGDVILLDGDDRVSVVRRRQARVRVVADEAKQYLLVIADWGTRQSAAPDGRVDQVWRFTGIEGRWPLESRWEGTATLLSPDMPNRLAGPALSLETPAGLVAFVGGPPGVGGPPDAAAVLRYAGMSGGGREGLSFDEAEQDAMSPNFMQSFSTMSFSNPGRPGAGAGGGNVWMSGGVSGGVTAGVPPATPSGVAQRVPRLVSRVEPEWPAQARAAGVQGVVIIEVTIALDGRVTDAGVLRSIPLLDDAALRAVRQWRFEPAGPERRPDPLRMTVTVTFPPRQP